VFTSSLLLGIKFAFPRAFSNKYVAETKLMSISGDHRPTSGNTLQVTALYWSNLDICHQFLQIKKLPTDRKKGVFSGLCAATVSCSDIYTFVFVLHWDLIGLE